MAGPPAGGNDGGAGARGADAGGTGQRVWLDGAFVTEITRDAVTVTQARWRNDGHPTPEQPYCGQGLSVTLVSLEVPWSGSRRPAYGTQLRLYGTTIPGSMTPTRYIRTGSCTVELVGMELC